MVSEKEIGWLLKEKYLGKPNAQFKKDVARLQKGEPLAYVIGFVEFLGCKIDLSKRPLIPRPETEFWLEKTVKALPITGYPLRVLDIFAGSGCIGVALLKHYENIWCDFVDVQKNCLEQIKINCNLNGIDKTRYNIIQSDMFENIKNKYDFIFANPPYIPSDMKKTLNKSVVDFEPHGALFGGKDGLKFVDAFLAAAKNAFVPGGSIYMEFDSPQKKHIEKLVKKFGYKTCQFHQDQYRKWRWVVIQ